MRVIGIVLSNLRISRITVYPAKPLPIMVMADWGNDVFCSKAGLPSAALLDEWLSLPEPFQNQT